MVTNEVLNTILSRKGVKQYKSNPVPRELLEAIVAAGIAAPNAFNRQAWHFSVITNKTLLEEIDAETNHRLGDEEGYHSLYGAPVLIVISSARDNNFAKQDCSAANENMALAAKSLGLASRYLDVPNLYTNTPEGAGCKEMCGIPKDYDTVCFAKARGCRKLCRLRKGGSGSCRRLLSAGSARRWYARLPPG